MKCQPNAGNLRVGHYAIVPASFTWWRIHQSATNYHRIQNTEGVGRFYLAFPHKINDSLLLRRKWTFRLLGILHLHFHLLLRFFHLSHHRQHRIIIHPICKWRFCKRLHFQIEFEERGCRVWRFRIWRDLREVGVQGIKYISVKGCAAKTLGTLIFFISNKGVHRDVHCYSVWRPWTWKSLIVPRHWRRRSS